jgi:DedD protein
MESPSKERLVGAIILVVLIVIFVPALLSGRKAKDAAETVSEDGAMKTYVIDLDSQEMRAAPEDQAAATETPQTSKAQTQETQPTPEDESQATAIEPEAQEAPVASTAPVFEAPPQAKPVEAQPPRTVTPAQQPETQPAPSINASTAKGWAVQLGSFSSRENATKLVQELNAKGYKAFVSRFDSGGKVHHRVRVGPEATRARADALAAKLRRDGRSASVVAHP